MNSPGMVPKPLMAVVSILALSGVCLFTYGAAFEKATPLHPRDWVATPPVPDTKLAAREIAAQLAGQSSSKPSSNLGRQYQELEKSSLAGEKGFATRMDSIRPDSTNWDRLLSTPEGCSQAMELIGSEIELKVCHLMALSKRLDQQLAICNAAGADIPAETITKLRTKSQELQGYVQSEGDTESDFVKAIAEGGATLKSGKWHCRNSGDEDELRKSEADWKDAKKTVAETEKELNQLVHDAKHQAWERLSK